MTRTSPSSFVKAAFPVAVVLLALLIVGIAAGIYFYNSRIIISQKSTSTYLHSTNTSLACTPATVLAGERTTCSATVDDRSSAPATPIGTVVLAYGATWTATCALSGSGSTASCSTNVAPTTTGPVVVRASYQGDAVHLPSGSDTTITVNIPQSQCQDPANISSHVYNPNRLQILRSCITVSGIVSSMPRREPDGDYHVWLHLDAVNASFSNDPSVHNGDLVVEIICALPITQQDAIPACQNYTNQITAPQSGQHINVSGPYVLDTLHNWYEIHPAYSLKITPATGQVVHVTSETLILSYPGGATSGWLGTTPRTISGSMTVGAGEKLTFLLDLYAHHPLRNK